MTSEPPTPPEDIRPEPPDLVGPVRGVLFGLGVVGLVVAFNIWLIWGATAGAFAWLVIGLVAIAVRVGLRYHVFADAIRMRWLVFGNVVLMTALAAAILVVVSYLNVEQLGPRVPPLDLTRGETYSLDSKTRTVLAALEAPLHVFAIRTPRDEANRPIRAADQEVFERVVRLLDSYARASNVVFQYFEMPRERDRAWRAFSDAGLNPESIPSRRNTIVLAYRTGDTPLARRLEIPVEEDRFVEHGATRTFFRAEKIITSGIVELVTQRRKVYFLKTHGEKTPFATEAGRAWSSVGRLLLGENFSFAELDLTQAAVVPEDCDALVIAGPRSRLSDSEVGAVGSYLERGGSGLFLFDPTPDEMAAYGLGRILERRYGIVPRTDLQCFFAYYQLFEGQGMRGQRIAPGPRVDVPTTGYTRHPVVQGLWDRYRTTFWGVSPIEALAIESLEVNELAFMPERTASAQEHSFPNFVAKVVPRVEERVQQEPPSTAAGDETGRFCIAAAAERAIAPSAGREGALSRVVVIGDSDFALDSRVDPRSSDANPENLRLVIGALQWLVGREELIEVPDKEFERERELADWSQLDDGERRTFFRAIWVVPTVGVPSFVLLLGLIVWRVRRS